MFLVKSLTVAAAPQEHADGKSRSVETDIPTAKLQNFRNIHLFNF